MINNLSKICFDLLVRISCFFVRSSARWHVYLTKTLGRTDEQEKSSGCLFAKQHCVSVQSQVIVKMHGISMDTDGF